MFTTALAITVYIACAKPQYVYVEKDGKEVWLHVKDLREPNASSNLLDFRVEGSEEDVKFHNAVLEELIKNKQNVNLYVNRCYKI